MNRFALIPLLFMIGVGPLSALGQSALGLESGKSLEVTFMGQSLLQREDLSLADFKQGKFESLGPSSDWRQVDVLQNGPDEPLDYYRETAQRPGRVEITWYIRYPSITYGALRNRPLPDSFGYSIDIPAHWLEDAAFKWAAPSKGKIGSPWRIHTGRISSDGDRPIATNIQFIAITPTRGKTFTLLLNPAGPQSCIPYFRMENNWTLRRQGDHYQLRATFPRPEYGDRREFKIVVLEGSWDTTTTGTRGRYITLRPSLRLAFSARPPHKHYQIAGAQLWQPGKAYGWLDNQGLSLRSDKAAGFWAHYIQPDRPATRDFILRAKEGELNLIHIAFGSREKAIGPFKVYVNGELKLDHLSGKAGEFQTKTTYGWAKDGKIRLTFEGNWRINGIGLTPLLEKSQDYLFSRTWWVDQKRFDRWEDRIEPTPPLEAVAFPSQPATREQRMAWTWNTSMEKGLEGSINGSRRAALETPEALRRRIEQIKATGAGALVINGLHFRFNFIGSKADAIARRNTRLAVQMAHQHGLKALCHLDLTWIFYSGIPRMLKLLDQDPDVLARSVVDPFTVQASPCLNSPAFETMVGDYLAGQIRQTGLDGYQLDEFSFEGEGFCGCDRCRALFHQQTGLTMPYENRGGWYDDRSNVTWRAYLRWQGRAERAVVDRLLTRLRQVNPNLVWMHYRSLALSHPAATKIDLADGFPYGCDYVGDEFHPNDILTNWRVAFGRFKTRQGAVASYGNFPTWYLPKIAADQDESQYLYAWAIARMNRGNCWWRTTVDEAFIHRLNTWKWQMDDRHARPIADVAVLLSRPTIFVSDDRQFFHEEYGGWLQALATENVQYNVILDRDIDRGRLKDYRVLILPNAAAMSDKTALAIEQFVRQGGQVIASYETGWFDASGAARKTPVLSQAMNLKPARVLAKGGQIRFNAPLDEQMEKRELTTASPLLAHPLLHPDRSQVWASIMEGNRAAAPAVVATPLGKGRFIYIAGNLIRRNYEPRMATVGINARVTLASRGTGYKTDFNPDLDRMVANLLHALGKGRFQTEAVKIPEGVIYAAFRQQTDKGPVILLHFLNVQGKPRLKLGEPVRLQAPIPQPPLPFDVEMRLRPDFQARHAFLVSPLKPGEVVLTPQMQPDGSCVLRIPKEAIVNYALVYVEP